MTGLLTSADVCWLADISYRQLDSWVRLGVIEPEIAARGTGTPRRWSEAQIGPLQLAARLRELGAPLDVVRSAVAETIDWSPGRWQCLVVVDRAGMAYEIEDFPADRDRGWLVQCHENLHYPLELSETAL